VIALEWLGTAGFRVSPGASHFLIDPYVTRSELARPRQPRKPADLRGDGPIFLSHGHFDHAFDVPEIVAGTGAAIHGSATALAPALRAGVPMQQLRPAGDGDLFDFGDFQAQAFGSRHVHFDLPLIVATLRRAGWEWLTALNLALRYPAGQVLSWRFTAGGVAVHFFGSAGASRAELRRLAGQRVDALLVPLQGHSRIGEIVLSYAEALRPRVLIPHHWDDFYPPLFPSVDPMPFVEMARRRFPDIRVIVPEINQVIQL